MYRKGKGKVKHSFMQQYVTSRFYVHTNSVQEHAIYYIHVQIFQCVIHKLKLKLQNMVTLSVPAAASPRWLPCYRHTLVA